MKSPLLGLMGFVLIGISGYAPAQTLVGTTTEPTGINGLVVDGTTYNVTFSITTYDSPFTQGSPGSLDAAAGMATALTSLGVTQLAAVSPTEQCPPRSNLCQYNSVLFVAVDNAPGLNDTASCLGNTLPAPLPCPQHSWTDEFTRDTGGHSFEQVGGLGPLLEFGYGYAADFRPAGVPEPGTLALLTIALAGLVVRLYRYGEVKTNE